MLVALNDLSYLRDEQARSVILAFGAVVRWLELAGVRC